MKKIWENVGFVRHLKVESCQNMGFYHKNIKNSNGITIGVNFIM